MVHHRSMSEKELQQLLEDIEIVTNENLADLSKARKMLEREGLYTSSGELAEPYR